MTNRSTEAALGPQSGAIAFIFAYLNLHPMVVTRSPLMYATLTPQPSHGIAESSTQSLSPAEGGPASIQGA